MTYYTNGRRVARIEKGSLESYCYPIGKWVEDRSLLDMYIGELDLKEVTEEEANAIIAKRNSEIHSN